MQLVKVPTISRPSCRQSIASLRKFLFIAMPLHTKKKTVFLVRNSQKLRLGKINVAKETHISPHLSSSITRVDSAQSKQ